MTVLLNKISQEIGDTRLAQLIHDKLAQAFEQAEASKNEAEEMSSRLDDERGALQQQKEELEAEQLALQEQQQTLYTAALSLQDLTSRVQGLSEAFDRLNDGLAEERLAARRVKTFHMQKDQANMP